MKGGGSYSTHGPLSYHVWGGEGEARAPHGADTLPPSSKCSEDR
jgi:hypothetical protein